MATIAKGKISSIVQPSGAAASVIPSVGDGSCTAPLTIPKHMRGTGYLKPGDTVLYAHFEDETGYIFDRIDGEWNGIFPGTITATNFATELVPNYNAHTHGGVKSGSENTSTPQ